MKVIVKREFENISYWQLGYSPFGKPKMYVYSFLIDGLLIDTGMTRVAREMSSALKEESIDKIILTHHHEDHSGNVESIKRLKNIEAYGSSRCCELMKNPVRVEPARWMTWGQNSPAHVLPLDLDKPLNTNQFSFEIIETPGHAIDHICLYEANKGWLFSGDIYVNDYINVFMRDEKIGQQIDSIERLLKLDFDVLLCNHQPILSNGKDRLRAKLQFLKDFYGKVKEAHYQEQSPKAIMASLGMKEQRFVKTMSLGQLSRLNMVRSVIDSLNAEDVNVDISKNKTDHSDQQKICYTQLKKKSGK